MTILIGFLLLLQQASTLQSTCPDLSGRYVKQGEDGRVYISIKQTRCETIEIEWVAGSYGHTSGGTHVLHLDGKFHEDTSWFGGTGKQLTSATFRSKILELIARPEKAADASAFPWKLAFELLPNGDICERFLDSHGSSSSVAGRQGSSDPPAEDEAARRSSEAQDPSDPYQALGCPRIK